MTGVQTCALPISIEGDVKGEDGAPKVNAVVKILRTDIKGSYKCHPS